MITGWQHAIECLYLNRITGHRFGKTLSSERFKLHVKRHPKTQIFASNLRRPGRSPHSSRQTSGASLVHTPPSPRCPLENVRITSAWFRGLPGVLSYRLLSITPASTSSSVVKHTVQPHNTHYSLLYITLHYYSMISLSFQSPKPWHLVCN